MAQIYQYDAIHPSDEFRILVLKAGAPGDALHGDITTASFDDDVKYVAVSYAWGPDVKTKRLNTPKGFIPITESLASALDCFRSRDEDILLWADAVCINQTDNHEKNHQVRRMRDVFAGAELVRVHLGEESDNSELVPDLLMRLAMVDSNTNGKLFTISSLWRHAIGALDVGSLPSLDDPAWEAVRAMFRRPWFSRVWVVQEYVVAKDVVFHCGSWAMPFRALSDHILRDEIGAYVALAISRNDPSSARGYIFLWALRATRRAYKNGVKGKLIDLLIMFQGSLATRGRDQLFAMLGLAQDADDPVFDPDYDEPLVGVVCRYAAALVRLGHGPQLLSRARVIPGGHANFPSWIPDWASERSDHLLLDAEVPWHRTYSASGQVEPDLSVEGDQTTLKMTGGFFDKIVKVGTPHANHKSGDPSDDPVESFVKRLTEAEKMASERTICPPGESIRTAFQATIISDRRDRHIRASREFLDEYPHAMDMLQKRHNFDAVSGEGNAEAWAYSGQAFLRLGAMRFCVTNKGYMGLCPNSTNVGDVVYILHGLHTPYVMRREPGRDDEHFRLVGQCYIHGIMDGEALNLPGHEPRDVYIW